MEYRCILIEYTALHTVDTSLYRCILIEYTAVYIESRALYIESRAVYIECICFLKEYRLLLTECVGQTKIEEPHMLAGPLGQVRVEFLSCGGETTEPCMQSKQPYIQDKRALCSIKRAVYSRQTSGILNETNSTFE